MKVNQVGQGHYCQCFFERANCQFSLVVMALDSLLIRGYQVQFQAKIQFWWFPRKSFFSIICFWFWNILSGNCKQDNFYWKWSRWPARVLPCSPRHMWHYLANKHTTNVWQQSLKFDLVGVIKLQQMSDSKVLIFFWKQLEKKRKQW